MYGWSGHPVYIERAGVSIKLWNKLILQNVSQTKKNYVDNRQDEKIDSCRYDGQMWGGHIGRINLPLLLLLLFAPLPLLLLLLLLLLLRWQVSSTTAAAAAGASVHSSSSVCQSRWFCGISGTNLARSTLTRSNRPTRDGRLRFYAFPRFRLSLLAYSEWLILRHHYG